jgi:hypothetical protein
MFALFLRNPTAHGMLCITNESKLILTELKIMDYYGNVLYYEDELLPKEQIEYMIEAEGSVELDFIDDLGKDCRFLILGYAYPNMPGVSVQIKNQGDTLVLSIPKQ